MKKQNTFVATEERKKVKETKKINEIVNEDDRDGDGEVEDVLKPLTISSKPEYKCKYKSSRYSDRDLSDVSSKLDNLLKRYIRLHDAQQRNFTITESIQSPLTWGNNTARYVIFEVDRKNGSIYENFYSLFTALLVALFLDRILLINNSVFMEAFCPPFKSIWTINENDFIKVKTNAITDKDELEAKVPKRAFIINDENVAMLQCGGYLKEIFEPVQFLIIQNNKHKNSLHLIKSNKAYEQAWYNDYFPNGLAIKPLFNSLFYPTNELWDTYKAILKEYQVVEKRLFKVSALVRDEDDLGRVKIIVDNIRGEVNVFLYIISIERINDLRLKEIYPHPAYSVSTSHHVYTREDDDWKRLSLDVQFVKGMDIFLICEACVNDILILHSIKGEKKKTILFNKEAKMMPLAACDNYNVRDFEC